MKVTVETRNLDIDSNEMKDLILRGVNIGKYNYSTYSKIQLAYMHKGDLIPNFPNYICGKLHKHFNVDILNKKDIENVMKLCKEKEHIDLIDWVNNMLQEESKKYYED